MYLQHASRRNVGLLQVLYMKPSDYPLGSGQSRVAARKLLEQRQSTKERVELILGRHNLPENQPRTSEWIENAKEGRRFRTIRIPAGMTLAEGLRAIGGYSQTILDCATASHPEPLGTATMLMLRR